MSALIWIRALICTQSMHIRLMCVSQGVCRSEVRKHTMSAFVRLRRVFTWFVHFPEQLGTRRMHTRRLQTSARAFAHDNRKSYISRSRLLTLFLSAFLFPKIHMDRCDTSAPGGRGAGGDRPSRPHTTSLPSLSWTSPCTSRCICTLLSHFLSCSCALLLLGRIHSEPLQMW